MKKIVIFIFVFYISFMVKAFAGDDIQYWSQNSFNIYKNDNIDFLIFTDARIMNDVEKLGLYFVSPRLTYHVNPNLDLGVNYTWIQSRSTNPATVDDSYNSQHRVEFEFNPKWRLSDWAKLAIRNRLEFRWIEKQGRDNTRFRQRWGVSFPIADQRWLKAVYMDSEFFYDFNVDDFVENRTIPLGLSFKLSDRIGLKVFYMIQSKKGTNDWFANQIIGSQFSWQF